MADARMLKVTLRRSPIGQNTRQRDTLRGLGLTRVGRTVIVRESDCVLGMIRKVQHLVQVEA
ncbi:MAG: 50S ribosomal protein L30 [Deltaproteobacteria bacterium]|jgi:large subunit ribosomal protein L30|nr:50S ribosomal protein L30 [Deltaproteobacteria bacterium]MBI3391065.1 50S ribosomal protein L30 [Deltaproteobacteria bacterium]